MSSRRQDFSEERFARLEAKVAELAALAAKGLSAASMPPSPPVPNDAVPVRKMPPKLPEAGKSEDLICDKQTLAVWQQMLERIKNKTSVHACLKTVTFNGFRGNVCELSTKSPFMKGKIEGDEYRRILEPILAELAGRPLRIACNIGKPQPPPPPLPLEEDLPPLGDGDVPLDDVDWRSLPPEERASVEMAVEMFGDCFVAVPEKEGQSR